MSETKPTSFEDLKPTELYRSAIEDFAIPVDEADKNKKKVLLAAFVEGGVSWADYVAQHPEVAPEPEPVPAVVTTSDMGARTDALSVAEPEEEVIIRVAEAPAPQVREKFLIRMVRDNLRFDVKGHSFTQEHPYALVSESTANHLLEKEDGFRMATPSELREYYG